jgi:outer membrane biosynthesis protein TonB
MPSLDSLPGDQRAVLEMVLARGRSYDEIARLLSLDRAKVRERAQIALDTIGPHTEVAPEHQHRIADYLLGQLPDAEVQEVRDVLADSPSDRAWARVVASELAPLTGGKPLPEIPVERSTRGPAAAPEPDAPAAPTPQPTASEPVTPPEPTVSEPLTPPPASGPVAEPESEPKRRRSSRLGGALVILVGVIAVAAVLFFVLRGGNSKKPATAVTTTAAPAASGSSTPTASTPSGSTPTTTTTGSSSASVVAQINLSPPSSEKKSKSAGIAEVLNEGSTDGIAIVAQHVPANTTKPANAYAVWLYNSAKDAKLLGFVTPAVDKSGRLQTAGPLPKNASHFKQLIVTVETTGKPSAPGSIVLQGALSGL